MDQLAHLTPVNVVFFVAGFVLAMSIFRKPAAGTSHVLPDDIRDEHIDAAIRAKQTIEAIKRYRARTHCGLKDAKEAVERRARQLDIHH